MLGANRFINGSEPEGKHHVPHIHVEYQGKEAIFDLEGDLFKNEQEYFKIPPLQ